MTSLNQESAPDTRLYRSFSKPASLSPLVSTSLLFLTFIGSDYEIWVLRARFSEDSRTWDGCSMMSICRSTCISKAEVRRLESWINEIYRWGLSGHSAGCLADVKTILEQNDVEMIDLEAGE